MLDERRASLAAQRVRVARQAARRAAGSHPGTAVSPTVVFAGGGDAIGTARQTGLGSFTIAGAFPRTGLPATGPGQRISAVVAPITPHRPTSCHCRRRPRTAGGLRGTIASDPQPGRLLSGSGPHEPVAAECVASSPDTLPLPRRPPTVARIGREIPDRPWSLFACRAKALRTARVGPFVARGALRETAGRRTM